jgi:hypothetical protein
MRSLKLGLPSPSFSGALSAWFCRAQNPISHRNQPEKRADKEKPEQNRTGTATELMIDSALLLKGEQDH